MEKIGRLGGMSWTSSLECYRLVNEELSAVAGALLKASGLA